MTEETYVKRSEQIRRKWVERYTLTAERCRALVANQRAKGGLDAPSRVNPTISRRQALDIFDAALAPLEPQEGVRILSCRNILRECGQPLGLVGVEA
jgi:hypothetical protein